MYKGIYLHDYDLQFRTTDITPHNKKKTIQTLVKKALILIESALWKFYRIGFYKTKIQFFRILVGAPADEN